MAPKIKGHAVGMSRTGKAELGQIFVATALLYRDVLRNAVYNRLLDSGMDLQSVFVTYVAIEHFTYHTAARAMAGGPVQMYELEQEMFPGRGSLALYDHGCPIDISFDEVAAMRKWKESVAL